MTLFLAIMSWTLSLTFIILKHPLSLGFVILLQTIIIALISGITNIDFWFSYILFLIMIGGMLVLFIYMTSIASNEKFKLSKKLATFHMFMYFIALITLFLDNQFYSTDFMNYDTMNQSFMELDNLSMNKLMNTPSMYVMLILMIYLLITLIAIVKITQSKMGPLRQTKF